jgi:uncharacterized low-complexity protein
MRESLVICACHSYLQAAGKTHRQLLQNYEDDTMNSKQTFNPLTLIASAALAASVISSPAQADANPFAMSALASGYMVSDAKSTEAKCGSNKEAVEAKCGADKAAARVSEAECGANKKAAEAKCGADKKAAAKPIVEAKCGEAKCGSSKK